MLWAPSDHCGVRFEQLFEPPDGFTLVELQKLPRAWGAALQSQFGVTAAARAAAAATAAAADADDAAFVVDHPWWAPGEGAAAAAAGAGGAPTSLRLALTLPTARPSPPLLWPLPPSLALAAASASTRRA